MQNRTIELSTVLSDKPSSELISELSQIYGNEESILLERARAWRNVAQAFRSEHGDREPFFIVRAPARVSFLGRHSDQQGGRANCICIPNEIIMASRARQDDAVVAQNLDPDAFPTKPFSIGEWVPAAWRGKTWKDYLHHALSRITPGEWMNYFAASFLMLQITHSEKTIRGIDAIVSGNIVLGAGLSSSSALNCAGTLAALHVNDVEMPAEEITTFSGQSEWFTGSRGGTGDHAAILLTDLGKVLHVGTKPSVSYEFLDFPEGCVLVAIDSGVTAVKTTGRAKSLYNERTATCHFGVRLLRKQGGRLDGLSLMTDLVSPELGLSEREVLERIKSLPERMSRSELRKELSEESEWLEQIVAAHEEPQDGYSVRKVCLFSAAECSRSRMVPKLLREGRLSELGRLMYTSHDGDRVVTFSENGTMRPYNDEAPDSYMDGLIAEANASAGPYTVLPHQPGGYPNSCVGLDRIVDICKGIEGVYGACMTGAGFGGHVVALADRKATDTLFSKLKRDYYNKEDIPFGAYLCTPASGASLHVLT